MDKEKLIIRLSTQIDTIKAHVNRLKKSGYNVHLLDVDMLRQKTIEFYELVFELENSINGSTKPEKTVIPNTEPSIAKPLVSESKVIEVIPEEKEEEKPVTESLKKNIEVVHEETKEEIVIDDAPEVIEKEDIIKHVEIAKPVVTPPPVEKEPEAQVVEVGENEEKHPDNNQEQVKPQQTTYDLFSGNSEHAVAEKFQANEAQSFADKMQKSSITNIREAIGINEKFLFINELFNGDLGRYNKILDDINDLPTKKGVDTYLLELKIQFQWADDNEAYLKLKELLDRKFR